VDASDLLTYVGATATQQDFAESCWAQAVALVGGFVGEAEVPQDVLDRACLEVGAELFHRKSTKNAMAQFATPDGNPIRIARDPMVAAYPLLVRYVGPGVA
jgi:hypothetical protein